VIAIVAVEGSNEGMFPDRLETGRSELEQEIAMELLECSLLATISFAWQVELMIAEAMLKRVEMW
jgi:hypothetical protein